MVLTRGMMKRSEFLKQRIREARAFILYLSVSCSDEFDDTEWNVVFGCGQIKELPSCLEELAKQCIRRHEIFNWKTGEEYCEGFMWIDILSILCKDLNVNVEYETAIGRGTTQRRYGNAALCALENRVKE